MKKINHYEWLDKHLDAFWKKATGKSLSEDNCAGIITAHGDKCYGYQSTWERVGIPFHHGIAIYLLTYTKPFCDQVRETKDGWVAPSLWVESNYGKFKKLFDE